jgi:methylmalonyl-CoA mutase
MADNKTKLFGDFPPVSTQAWMDKIAADLKGADFEKKLVWRTNEGFSVRPFYREEDITNLEYLNTLPGEFPYVRGVKTDNAWLVRQNIVVENVKEANAKALDVLMKGVDSLGFAFRSKDQITKENLSLLLSNICLESAEVNFSSPGGIKLLCQLFAEYVAEKGYDAGLVKGSINYDPFGRLLCKGSFCCGTEIDAQYIGEMIALTAGLPQFRVLTVNGVYFCNAGSYITQELGYALAMGSEYMAKLTAAGIPADDVASNIRFNFGVDSNYFMEIAKFRASRLLWAQIVTQYGAKQSESAKMIVHAETSKWNMTIYDAHVNMLRTQTEAMSAALGGVHSMAVLPFDIVFRTPDAISERIARNQQLLLKEESHFSKITDPSSGSYYIENLTDSIINESWKLFVGVEEQGGYFEAMKAGTIQAAVQASSNARRKNLAQRKDVLLGTNQYPNNNEVAADKITKLNSCCCCGESVKLVETLDCGRGAEAFESLRLTTEKAAKRPVVFMLKLGNVAMRQARAQFAGNFFGCAGYQIIDNLGYKTVEEGVKASVEAAADIVVICSSDDEYAELAPKAFDLINNKAIFVVAGQPACMDDLKAVGINNFIHMRSNVLEELEGYNAKMGL